MILEQYLPQRQAADVVAGRVSVRLGGQEYTLPVLTIAENEAWLKSLGDQMQGLVTNLMKADSGALVMVQLLNATGLQLEILTSYDKNGVLPEAEAIRAEATGDQLLVATLEVLAAAYPTGAVLLDLVVRNPDLIRELLGQKKTAPPSSTPTNGSPPPTAGRRAKSAKS